LELGRLEGSDRLAELPALRAVAQGRVEASLGQADRQRRDGDTSRFEDGQELLEAAPLLAHQVAEWHPDVVEDQLAGVRRVPAELAVLGRLGVTGSATLDGDAADLFLTADV